MYERNRIPVDELEYERDLLLDKSKFSGGEIARFLGVNPSTVWSWFSKRGIPPHHAILTADILTQWAMELLEAAQRLRRVGRRYEEFFENGGVGRIPRGWSMAGEVEVDALPVPAGGE